MEDINIGQLSEAINDKADRDLNNITRPYITEQYDDGNGNGYRVWSNKWCEQYGIADYGSLGTDIPKIQINFPKEYKDKLYQVYMNGIRTDRDTESNGLCAFSYGYFNAQTTGCCLRGFYTGSNERIRFIIWKSEGYIL